MVNSVGNNSAITALYAKKSSKLPDIPDLLTSGQSDMGDSEIEKKIMELARRDVAAGTNSKFTSSNEWRKLINDYVSAVSPDRKGIIKNTLSGLANSMSSMNIRFNSRNFFQVLFQNCGLFGSNDIGSNFIRFRDENGNEIAMYDEYRGWTVLQTPAEDSRRRDFMIMWDEAMAKASQET